MPNNKKIKGHPFEVKVEGQKISGVTLSDQIKNFDWKTRIYVRDCRGTKRLVLKDCTRVKIKIDEKNIVACSMMYTYRPRMNNILPRAILM